jgi:integrase
MNIVQPIRDKDKLEDLKKELKKTGTRNYMLFYTGLNSGMRVSDVVKLNIDDVRNTDGSMKQHIIVIEKKTQKIKKFPLCNGLLAEMTNYTNNMKQGEYLFKSRNGKNTPITTTQAYRIINGTGTQVGLEEIGTHTMRKTFGYWHYQQFHDIALLQTILNHSSPSVTLRYIGISQDEIDTGYKNFSL